MMKLIINFRNDESGAVTVDWVVLTAAIVGIGISVITVISGGVQSASEEIDGGLQVASNFKFSFDRNGGATTLSEYQQEYGEDYVAIYSAIENDAPDGYSFSGEIDAATDTAIYYDNTGETTNLSINGEVIDATVYYADLEEQYVSFGGN